MHFDLIDLLGGQLQQWQNERTATRIATLMLACLDESGGLAKHS